MGKKILMCPKLTKSSSVYENGKNSRMGRAKEEDLWLEGTFPFLDWQPHSSRQGTPISVPQKQICSGMPNVLHDRICQPPSSGGQGRGKAMAYKCQMEWGSSKRVGKNPLASEIMVLFSGKASYFLESIVRLKPSNQAWHCPYCRLTPGDPCMSPTVDFRNPSPWSYGRCRYLTYYIESHRVSATELSTVKSLAALTPFRCTRTSTRGISTLLPLFSSTQPLCPFRPLTPCPCSSAFTWWN